MDTKSLNGIQFRGILMSGAASLYNSRSVVDNLNVFPIPDGDTGTNMSTTMSTILSGSFEGTESIAAYSALAAKEMFQLARGNSGVILSSFFRGVARVLDGHDTADPSLMLEGMKEGARTATAAIENPVEGTILTVMRECTDEIDEKSLVSYEAFFGAVYEKAKIILDKTPEMLPALRRAHVVDSGGYGFVTIIDGMKNAAEGNAVTVTDAVAETVEKADFGIFSSEEIKYAFCTECLLDLAERIPDEKIRELKSALRKMGDSMVFSSDGELLKLHIHTNEPLKVFATVFPYGTVRTSKIENMKLQHTGLVSPPVKKTGEKKKYGIFAVSPGDGFSDLFKELGADEVITGGQKMNPSVKDIAAAVDSCPCETAIILPNNGNIILAANQVAEMAGKDKVIVIPAKTLPQGVSALFAYNESRTPDENREIMTKAAGAVTTFSFTRAVRDAEVNGKSVVKRQFLGIRDGNIESVTDRLRDGIGNMIPQIVKGDLITIYYGERIKPDYAEKIYERIREAASPSADVTLVDGGQPLYHFIISTE